MKLKRIFPIVLVSVICLCLLSCIESDDALYFIKVNQDGTALVTMFGTNVRIKDGEVYKNRNDAIAYIKKYCKDELNKQSPDQQAVACGVGTPKDIFGPGIPVVKSSASRVDAFITWKFSNGADFFKDMATEKEGKTVQMEYIQSKHAFNLKMQATVKEKNKNCTIIIHSPWSIASTNADILLGGYHLAAWNCSKMRKGESFYMEIQSRL